MNHSKSVGMFSPRVPRYKVLHDMHYMAGFVQRQMYAYFVSTVQDRKRNGYMCVFVCLCSSLFNLETWHFFAFILSRPLMFWKMFFFVTWCGCTCFNVVIISPFLFILWVSTFIPSWDWRLWGTHNSADLRVLGSKTFATFFCVGPP